MRKRAQDLGVLLVVLAVIMVAGAIPAQAQGSLEEDTPTEDTWQSIMHLHQQGEARYYEYQTAAGHAHLYLRTGDTWTNVTPAGQDWEQIQFLWDQGEKAYFALFYDPGTSLRGYVYKLENGTFTDVTPEANAEFGIGATITFLDEMDGKMYASFCAGTPACGVWVLDNDTITSITPNSPFPRTWEDFAYLGRRGMTQYYRWQEDDGNQYLYDEEASTTRQAQPHRVEALTDRTPPGGPWKLIEFLEVQNGKRYFHLKDTSDNNHVRALDDETWEAPVAAPGVWQERCALGESLFHVYSDPAVPDGVQARIRRLENGSLVDKTPAPPPEMRWTEILCYGHLDGKGYLGFLEDAGGAHLFEQENGALTDLTPTASTWKEIEALGPMGMVKYFRSKDETSNEDHIYRRKSVVSRSQTLPQQDDEVEDITPTGTWKRISYQTELADKDYIEFVDKDSDRANLYRLDGNTWQDLTPEAPPAAKWKSINFQVDYYGTAYYEFLDDSDEAHFYEIDDSSDVARPVKIDRETRDLTPEGKWRRMRFLHTGRHKSVFRFDDDSQKARFFELIQSGTVAIKKVTIPAGGGGFLFAQNILEGLGDFPLDHDGEQPFLAVLPGQYSVTEYAPSPHWDLTGLVCEDSDEQGVDSTEDKENRKATINVDPGETVTCTFTNTERGTIIIEKETVPGGGGGFQFSQNVEGADDLFLDDGQSKTFLEVLPGQYAVTELDPLESPGHYDLSGLVCDDSDPQGVASTTDLGKRRATINLDPGETVTCTFTNRKWGMIAVEKATEPGDQPTAFTFSGKINVELKDGERKNRWVRPGTYAVQETVPVGWDLTAISCSDSNSSGDLSSATATYLVKAGEWVKCTFTNTEWGKITVQKQTSPAGADKAFSFAGALGASLKDGQSASLQVKPGTYKITEALPANWSLSSITCDDSDSTGDKGSRTATFRVDPGEHVTCVFGNTHQDVVDPPGTIVVAQKTVSPGGATNLTFTYTGDVAGQARDGQRLIQGGLQAGAYTSHQLVPEGWLLASITCDDADSTGDVATATATYRLQAGETVVCTFTDLRLYDYHVYLPLVLR